MKMKEGLGLIFCFISAMAYSQARTNAELPVITDTGRELSNVIGWALSQAGQWVSKNNEIPMWYENKDFNSGGINKFKKLKLYTVSYQQQTYYMLDIVVEEDFYRYPNIREGRYVSEVKNLYLIKSVDFVFHLKRDKSFENDIKLFGCYFNHRSFFLENEIRDNITKILQHPTLQAGDRRIDYGREDILGIQTYYYTDDNVVRFYFIKDSPMPENYYFECDYESFVNFLMQNLLND